LLNGINWIGCFAHTLQLVIGKGLYIAKTLILRVKHLIDFFMIPKQSERLEKIQKNHPSLASNEEDEEPVVCIISLINIYVNVLKKLCY
jgi:hypothetical protein